MLTQSGYQDPPSGDHEDALKKIVLLLLILSISASAYAKRPSSGVEPASTRDIATATPKPAELPENPQAAPGDAQAEDLKTGMQYYHERKYPEAISALSRYATLAPKSPQRTAALLIIGKSLDEMNRLRSALNIYNRVAEQYPNTPEALLAVVAMADIGVDRPPPDFRSGHKWSEYVKDPVMAYDAILAKNTPLPIVEHIHLQRARALAKSKRHREAHYTLSILLQKFPQTGYREQARGLMRECSLALIDQYSLAEDHLAVADIFKQGWKEGMIRTEDTDALVKSSFSLARLGLVEESSAVITALRRSAAGKPRSYGERIEKMVAEMQNHLTLPPSDSTPAAGKWRQFQTGRDQLNANQPTLAEKTLNDLKSGNGDPFWAKITEYLLEENRWVRKYQRQIGS